MARFDVYRFPPGGVPLVLDVQANLLNHLYSPLIVPPISTLAPHREDLPRLKPSLQVGGQSYLMVTTDLTVFLQSGLGDFVENIEDQHGDEILSALAFLFSGF